MIKTVKYIFMIFLLSLVINCQDENNPIKSKITEDDLYIKNMFVGKWQFVSIQRRFNKDGTFYDPIYTPPSTRNPSVDPIVCTELESNGLYLDQVVYGKYKVENRTTA